MRLRYITEKCYLVLYTCLERMLCTAYKNIRTDSHSLKFLNTCLSWLSLHLTRCFKIRNKCYMNKNCVLMSDFMLELSDCFKERLTFDIADSTTYFYNCNLSFIS